ncbi:hypothetical protein F4803DRAFT_549967 [Xylaria telfairii]|nr:hypothetical protein F4803DRAFT_549967 [Xylaria telfairii]
MLKLLILILLRVVYVLSDDVNIDDLFTIQTGSANGGCNARVNPVNILDDWHQEAIDSITTAISAIEKYNQGDKDGERVRNALFDFFKIPTAIPKDKSKLKPLVQKVSDNLKHVEEWFSGENKGVDKDSTYLFCDSTYLAQKDPNTDTAQDYLGKDIIANGEPVPISGVAVYANDLKRGNVPWWAGDHTNINGYYFTSPNSGGNYCAQKNFGLTSTLRTLKQDANGIPVESSDVVSNVVLCPYAFDNDVQKNSYKEAVLTISEGTSLEDAVPKSTTLLHEAFHLVLGSGSTGFLEGNSEIYGLAKCIEAAMKNAVGVARKNPENYVFFTAAMYYLFGDKSEGVITTNWDFTNGPDKAKTVS